MFRKRNASVHLLAIAGGVCSILAGQTPTVLDTAIAVSPDGKFAIVGSSTGSLTLWDLESHRVAQRYSGFRTRVAVVAFDKRGSGFIATAPRENAAQIYTVSRYPSDADRGPLGKFPLETAGFDYNAVTYGCQNAYIWGNREGIIKRYVPRATEMEQYRGHDGPVTSVVESPNCGSIVSGSGDGRVLLWRVGRAVPKVVHDQDTRDRDAITAVAFSPNGAYFAAGSESGRIWVFAADGSQISAFRAYPYTSAIVSYIAFSPDGRLVLAALEYAKVRIWNSLSGEFVGQIGEGKVSGFATAGDRAIIGGTTLEIWSISQLKQLARLRPNE